MCKRALRVIPAWSEPLVIHFLSRLCHRFVMDVTCEVKDEYRVGLDLAFGRTKELGSNSKLWDSQPLVAKPTAKYHISIVFSIKLRLKLIWLKVSSAFNL